MQVREHSRDTLAHVVPGPPPPRAGTPRHCTVAVHLCGHRSRSRHSHVLPSLQCLKTWYRCRLPPATRRCASPLWVQCSLEHCLPETPRSRHDVDVSNIARWHSCVVAAGTVLRTQRRGAVLRGGAATSAAAACSWCNVRAAQYSTAARRLDTRLPNAHANTLSSVGCGARAAGRSSGTRSWPP
jgi:hypothetical protein